MGKEIDWSKSNILVAKTDPNFAILSTKWDAKSKNLFQGMVVKSEDKQYPVGEYSETWHKNKFELSENPIILKNEYGEGFYEKMEKETKMAIKPEEVEPEVEEGMYCSTCKTYTMYEVGNVFLCDECGNWCYSSS